MRDSTTFGSSAEASLVPGAVILLGLDESAKRYVRLVDGRVVANDDAGLRTASDGNRERRRG